MLKGKLMPKLDKRKRYENKRQIKKVSFNVESDKGVLMFSDTLNFSTWVKQKLLEEMKKQGIKYE